MSPWFRRRRKVAEPQPEQAAPAAPPAESPAEPPAGDDGISSERLDAALHRLRDEIPAPSEERPPEPSA